MRPLRAAVIGLGVGEAHVEGYRSHPGCQVVAVCDIAAEKREMAHSKWPGVAVVADAAAILDDPAIDVVSIATYDDQHFEQVLRAIERGKHVFVEKPLCLHAQEARRLRKQLASAPGVRLSSNLVLRRSPRFVALKGLIDAGELGHLTALEGSYEYGRLEKLTDGWRGDLEFYSVVHGGGVHLVDLFLWLTGDLVDEVAAFGNRIASQGSKFRFNDLVVTILKFRSGIVGTLSCVFGGVHPHFHRLNVHGTCATFVNALETARLYTSRNPKDTPRVVDAPYPGVNKAALVEGFVRSLLGDTPPEVSVEDVFRGMSVCLAIEEASAEGRPVKVEYI